MVSFLHLLWLMRHISATKIPFGSPPPRQLRLYKACETFVARGVFTESKISQVSVATICTNMHQHTVRTPEVVSDLGRCELFGL